MRVPKMTQLTKEQKNVYLYAPIDQDVLVEGPPGTGKTVIACQRAFELGKRGVPVVLGMFNAVLRQYASKAGDDKKLPSQTVHRWFSEWWRSSGLPPRRGPEVKVRILAPYEEKDHAKELGARWDNSAWRPKARKPGAWVMDGDLYHEKRALLPPDWETAHDPPKLEGGLWIDWEAVYAHISEHDTSLVDSALSQGAVLIDEGQDFPPAFYKALRLLSACGAARGSTKVPHPVRCFVLADENQQLTEYNSTLDQIATALKVAPEHRYKLLDNFRNTKQIAELARSFFNDVGVLPNLPRRSGPKPTFVAVGDQPALVQRVKTWVVNNPGKEVGVLTFSEPGREALYRQLEEILSTVRGREIRLQTYSSRTWQENKAKDLVFDEGDVVTVLNLQSCKGLEFDAAFIADLHQSRMAQQAADRFKMQMFVAVSRARESVTLIDSGPQAGIGEYVELLPDERVLDREAGTLGKPKASLPATGGQTKVQPAASRSASPRSKGDIPANWEASVRDLVKQLKLDSDDKRSRPGGSYWVFGGHDLAKHLEPLGFQYAAKRSGWWRK